MKQVDCVHVINKHRAYKVDRKKVSVIASEICRRLGVAHYEVCLQFVSPRMMRSLNKQYREKDKSTDVLSFPQYSWKRPLKFQKDPAQPRPLINPMPLGDVVISADDAATNALDSKQDLAREICFLLVHGILHLVGHDHMKPTDKKRMFAEQRKLMRLFSGSKSKSPAWADCVKPLKAPTKSKAKDKPKMKKALSSKAKSLKKSTRS